MSTLPDQLCPACSALRLSRGDFEESPWTNDKNSEVIRQGSIAELKSSEATCGLCRLMLGALRSDYRNNLHLLVDGAGWKAEWGFDTAYYPIQNTESLYGSGSMEGSGIYTSMMEESFHAFSCIQLAVNANPNKIPRIRAVEPRVSLNLMSRWISKCKHEHVEECKPAEHPLRWFLGRKKLRCIDVDKLCLREIGVKDAFVALSYVWGNDNYPRTQRDSIHKFHQPGAFATEKLPNTIEDAIHVAKSLGYKYIWVDSLCIVQDDEEEKAMTVDKINDIYGVADLTIVAGSGYSATSGLEGWHANSSWRVLPSATIAPGVIVTVRPCFNEQLVNSAWASRGWTYQEGALSARCLIFLNGFAYFYCQKATWREDFAAETDDVRSARAVDTFGSSEVVRPLQIYKQHVRAYTSRTLTFQADINRAFAGILAFLKDTMQKSAFHHGLPTVAFDWAMLWRGSVGPSTGRRDSFPSWSWQGYIGTVNMADDDDGQFDQDWLRRRTWVDWYAVSDDGRSITPVWEPLAQGCIETWSDGENSDNGNPKDDDYNIADTSDEDSRSKNSDTESLDNEDLDNNDDERSEDAMPRCIPDATEGYANSEGSSSHDLSWPSQRDTCCPSYRLPLPGNPYGRSRTRNMEFLRQFLTEDAPFNANASTSIDLNYKNYLYFSTLLCSFFVEQAVFSHDSEEPSTMSKVWHTLRNNAQEICGLVQIDTPETSMPLNMEVLPISYEAPNSVGESRIGSLKGWQEPPASEFMSDLQQLGSGIWYRCNFFNVLCITTVQKSPRVVKRIGLGIIYKKALDTSLEPTKWTQFYMR